VGGSGGGRDSYPSSPEDIQALRREALEELRDQERQVAVNEVLSEALAKFNARDVEGNRERLDAIQEALEGLAIDVDRLLFGGSVAKHTYVDGLSDVDALVVVEQPDAGPDQLVERFRAALEARLRMSEVQAVSAGTLAVTVHYQDGSEIQLLPAVERDGRTSIPSEDGTTWRHIRPHKFAEKLTQVNNSNGRAVVPTIKLAKAVLRHLPENQQLSGYHVEAIAVDAFRSYEGRRDRASMLVHLVRHAQQAVLRPTGDITGQSVHIDEYLGRADSPVRQALSAALGRIASRLERGTAGDCRRLLND
jgi:predicted nucleotidyltransferase